MVSGLFHIRLFELLQLLLDGLLNGRIRLEHVLNSLDVWVRCQLVGGALSAVDVLVAMVVSVAIVGTSWIAVVVVTAVRKHDYGNVRLAFVADFSFFCLNCVGIDGQGKKAQSGDQNDLAHS